MKEIIETLLADGAFSEGTAWRRRQYPAGRVVVREGERGDTLYYIESGRLRVTGRVELEDRCRVQPGLCDLTAGDVFGELCLFGAGRRTATVTALEASQLVEIDAAALDDHLERHPEMGYRFFRRLFQLLAMRLGHTDRQMEHLLAWGLKAHGIEKYL